MHTNKERRYFGGSQPRVVPHSIIGFKLLLHTIVLGVHQYFSCTTYERLQSVTHIDEFFMDNMFNSDFTK